LSVGELPTEVSKGSDSDPSTLEPAQAASLDNSSANSSSTCAVSSAVLPCSHCGEPTVYAAEPAKENRSEAKEDLVFCCQGCAGAYHLIRGLGLEQFYALRDQSSAAGVSLREETKTDFRAFDNPEFLGESAPEKLANGSCRVGMMVEGLHCSACAWLIENALQQETGILATRIDAGRNLAEFVFDPSRIQLSTIAQRLSRLGYRLHPQQATAQDDIRERESRRMLSEIAVSGFFAANAMWIAVAVYAGAGQQYAYFLNLMGSALGLFSVLWPGRVFLQGAINSFRTRTPHMDLPVGLGLSVGTAVGTTNAIMGSGHVYFDSLCALVFLLQIGRWLKFRQQSQASKAVDLMLRVMPQHAHRVQGGETEDVRISVLKADDTIEVRSGESVPADGRLLEILGSEGGVGRFDCALLTGESQPVGITVGADVAAGSVNVGSDIRMRVSAVGADSRMGNIMQQVEQAASNRTPLVLLADRIGGVFVVVVTLLAILTFALWLPESLTTAVSSATSVLIVACPCALALATPLAIAVGIGRSAQRSVLIRDGGIFQQLAHRGHVWLDKTGTLTSGRQRVTSAQGDPEAIRLAAIVEQGCMHPVAAAIRDYARVRGQESQSGELDGRSVENLECASNGRVGRVDGTKVLVGNPAFAISQEINWDSEEERIIEQLQRSNQSPIVICADGRVAAILGISDSILPGAAAMISRLKQQGWSVGILSGDQHQIVQQVGQKLGIPPELCLGSLSPEDKLRYVEDSAADKKTTVMVGDGANDAAALAAADVGVAVRGGTEVSLMAAPVIMNRGISDLADLLRAAGRTQFVIQATFAVSIAYNIFAVSLAISGHINPLIAAVLMPISSLTVLAMVLGIPTYREDS
jgi:Cu2+-exporting ATPase